MFNATERNENFGTYYPKKITFPLILCRRLGFGRGSIKKKLIKTWHSLGYSIVDSEVRGIKYRLNIAKNTTVGKILVSSKKYDALELSYLTDICTKRPNSTFIDIGANTGYYSLNLAKSGVKKILSIEANPEVVDLLIQNIQFNDFNNQIRVCKYCTGEDGEMAFYTSSDWGGSSVFKRNHMRGKVVTVQSKPLIAILEEYNVQNVSAIKIDVEGYEDQVLIPYFTSCPKDLLPRVIIIEHCNQSDWQTNVINLLTQSSYIVKEKTRANTILIQS
jgi:FkbM family methyltransferase